MKAGPTQAHCPSPSELRQLCQRDLPEGGAVGLEAHLRDCPACRQVYESVRAETVVPATPPILRAANEAQPGEIERAGGGPSPMPPRAPSANLKSSFPFLAPPEAPDELGWLGSYRIFGVLGEGGMGFVFDAFDTQLQRRVALKVLKPELAANLSFRERFLQEARAAAALPDEHIITVYQVGLENDVPFLAMKYLHGESLEQRIQRERRMAVREVRRIGRQIALGLSVAHEHGLIHRDIKPGNIWLESAIGYRPSAIGQKQGQAPASEDDNRQPVGDSRVKILDFGLARTVNGSRHLTATGLIVGTPSYLAPEQARGLALDHRCDLFSLGCVLYRMVTGVLPFDGPNTMAQLTALAVDDPKPLEELAPEVPADLRDLIHQLLARDPADRPQTARAVAEALQSMERSDMPANEFASLTTKCTRTLRSPAADKRPPSRSPWLPAVGLVLCGLLLAGAWLVSSKRRSPEPDQSPPVAPPSGEPIKIGVLFSLQGTMASTGMPATDVAILAIDELNENGGLLGRPVEAVVKDGESDNRKFAELAEQLIVEDRVRTIIGCRTSASRKTVRPVVEKHDNLLLYPMQFEGLEQSPNIVYLGAAPNQQILPAVRYAVRMMSKQRIFLVGSDYVFPRTANAIIRDALARELDVKIVGEKYIPFGSSAVDETVQAIAASKADLILNTINGDTNSAFFRALHAASITADNTPVLSFSIAENDLRSLTDAEAVGHFAAWNYFQSVDRPENKEFIRKFRDRFGPKRVISDPMEAVYFGVQLWAQAVRQAGSTEPRAIREAIKGQSCNAPEGPVRIDPDTQYTWKEVRMGRIVPGGQFEIIWSSGKNIRPEPFPSSRSREKWGHFLDDLNRWWGGRWEAPRW